MKLIVYAPHIERQESGWNTSGIQRRSPDSQLRPIESEKERSANLA